MESRCSVCPRYSVSFGGLGFFCFFLKGFFSCLKLAQMDMWNISPRHVKHPARLSGHRTVCHCSAWCRLKCELRDFCLRWGSFVFPVFWGVFPSKNCEQIWMDLSSGFRVRHEKYSLVGWLSSGDTDESVCLRFKPAMLLIKLCRVPFSTPTKFPGIQSRD